MTRSTFLPCVPDRNAEVGMWMRLFYPWQQYAGKLQVTFGLQHGEALTKMVKESDADVVLFMEMDGLVYRPEIIETCFAAIESGQVDIVGSERMSCSPEIARIAKEKFGLNYEGIGDHGPGFWPNFFFVRRDILMKTDLDFSPKTWKKGELLFGEEVQEDSAGDTMVWMSLQLRNLVPRNRIRLVPQYHSHPDDLKNYAEHTGIFDGNGSWVHLGSISGDPFVPKTEMERLELTKRLAYKAICEGKFTDPAPKYIESGAYYKYIAILRELLHI